MRDFTKIHFQIVRFLSLFMAIINFLGVAAVLCVSIFMFIDYYCPVWAGLLTLLIGTPFTFIFGILLIKVYKLYTNASKMDDEFLKTKRSSILGRGIFFSIV